MREFKTLDEVSQAVGEELGTSGWLEIDQSRVDLFADATGDHQWIHIDVERAAKSPFGGTIAHGYLTMSLIPRFAAELYTVDFGGARVNYGANKLRFPSPVPVGSALVATATVTDVSETAAGIVLTTKFVITVEGAAKPSCVAETLTVVTP